MNAKVTILACGVLLLATNYLIFEWILKLPFGTYCYIMHSYFFVVAFLGHFILNKPVERPQQAITRFMAIMTGKLFISLAFLVVYLFKHKGMNNLPFAISFFCTHMVYTLLEVFLQFTNKKAEN